MKNSKYVFFSGNADTAWMALHWPAKADHEAVDQMQPFVL